MARALFALGSILLAAGVAADPGVPAVADLAAGGIGPWVDLLKSGGALTVAGAASWFALRKDGQVEALTATHAAELKAAHDQVVALVGASTAASAEMKAAVLALKDSLLSLERALDRKP